MAMVKVVRFWHLGSNVIHEAIDFFTNNEGDVIVSNLAF